MTRLPPPVGGTERGPAHRASAEHRRRVDHPGLRVRASVLLAQPGRDRADTGRGDLHAVDGRIVHESDASTILDASDSVAVPALSNAHDHGRPMPHLAFGAGDGALETWLPDVRRMPDFDPEASAVCFYGAMLRAGITSVLHHERPADPDPLLSRLIAAGRVARQLGIAVALAVPMMDRGHLLYDDTAVAADELAACGFDRSTDWVPQHVPDVAEQLAVADALDATVGGDGVTIQYGPAGPQWCSSELLEAIAGASERTGRRVHMHLLETARQREWADRTHPDGLVRRLDDLGLLTSRLSVAHGVWLRDDEMELLAERQVVVVTNASSNLRLRSGRAPVHRMRQAGIDVAMGLDGTTIDDDLDPWKELRLHHLLHAGTGMKDAWTAADAFHSTMSTGHRVVTGHPGPHGLQPGAPADIVLLDRPHLLHHVHQDLDLSAALMARGGRSAVRHVVAGGRVVVRDGQVLGVDEHAAAAQVEADLARAGDGLSRSARQVRPLQAALRRWYTQGRP